MARRNRWPHSQIQTSHQDPGALFWLTSLNIKRPTDSAFDPGDQTTQQSRDKHGFTPAANNSHGEGEHCNSAQRCAA